MVEITLSIILQFLQTAGILVGIIYYITIMRNAQRNQAHQLETRQAQMFMNVYNQSFTNPFYHESLSRIFDAEWDNYEKFKSIYHFGENKDPEFCIAYDYVCGFFESLGVLVREHFLDIRLVALLISGQTRAIWELNQRFINEFREDLNQPRLWSEFEYLYHELMKYFEKHPELNT
jgi:hypothetical protein